MKYILLLSVVFLSNKLFAQNINSIINPKEVERVEQTLSSDEMEGRRVFTPGIEKAAKFIETEFKKADLQTLNGFKGYRQTFYLNEMHNKMLHVTINGKSIPDSLLTIRTFSSEVTMSEKDNLEIVTIKKGDNFRNKFFTAFQSNKNLLVLIDSSFNNYANRIKGIKQVSIMPSSSTQVFVFGTTVANSYSVHATSTIEKKELHNLVGVLPGKKLADEYVIFSGHYDHLGVGSPAEGIPHNNTDSIYNGANDDASGTTAVITLAKYFAAKHDNERSIIFACFTAEEIGEYGSEYFSEQFNPDKVMAMFNIEMIGTESKWGKNSAYITGYEKTDMGKILAKNLEGSAFAFNPDPYPDQNLFYRSDNATLAKKGVPAHTISTSKMDSEPNYHKASDEIGTLDMNNMAEIIKSIAISATSIVKGKDTPSRVDAAKLK